MTTVYFRPISLLSCVVPSSVSPSFVVVGLWGWRQFGFDGF
jgi:hypothetical protein